MPLRTIRSSLRSDFDYAQDDTVEKAQGISRSGISAGQRKKAANLTDFGTPNENRSRLRARSLRGSDMPPACHSLPLRLRFPWLKKRNRLCRQFRFFGTRNGNRTHNYPLGGGYYIHLTMQAYGYIISHILIIFKSFRRSAQKFGRIFIKAPLPLRHRRDSPVSS